jgi:hypothetical protein
MDENMRAFRDRWQTVNDIELQELRSASMELKWQQLNAIFAMAKALDLLQPDPSEAEVHQRWAMLKEKYEKQSQNP